MTFPLAAEPAPDKGAQDTPEAPLRPTALAPEPAALATEFEVSAVRALRGPNFWQMDLAASKRFQIAGPAAFEFRLEAFNLFNRTNFRSPNGNRSSGAFGTITATQDPRQLQLGFKLLW